MTDDNIDDKKVTISARIDPLKIKPISTSPIENVMGVFSGHREEKKGLKTHQSPSEYQSEMKRYKGKVKGSKEKKKRTARQG